jgi:hypothetical protein
MVAAGLGAHPQQPRHVHPGKGSDDARRRLRIRHLSSRAALPAASLLFRRAFLPPDRAAGKSGSLPIVMPVTSLGMTELQQASWL